MINELKNMDPVKLLEELSIKDNEDVDMLGERAENAVIKFSGVIVKICGNYLHFKSLMPYKGSKNV